MIPKAANNWLSNGEHGDSSETIFSYLTGIQICRCHSSPSHPRDPDDFKRCEKLLRAVPEFRKRFSEMAYCSEIWATLVDHWEEIIELLEAEVPGVFDETLRVKGEAPRTYALMGSLGC